MFNLHNLHNVITIAKKRYIKLQISERRLILQSKCIENKIQLSICHTILLSSQIKKYFWTSTPSTNKIFYVVLCQYS